ncbi:hypothetical protein O3797_03190 [Gemella sanguinis]|jgi:hypothetical protein|uniref:hypothetical protein n=1 Tax=Gemella sanguinis TaxID=84135 RepID=UPI0020523512|nr:MAG TPA: putative antitoxin of bacterial toxin-antitoxin system, YdaS/YdaT [Bacteriophage sp.]
MKKEIEELLNSDLTSYKIAKETGITVQQIDRYRKNNKVGNITLDNALKLYNYKERLEMKNYDKMMLVVKELVLEEGAFISYWKEDSNNDITTVYSVDELKAHLGNLNDEDFENIVIQVNFDNQEKDYQITLNDFDAVHNKNEFILDLLHNTR